MDTKEMSEVQEVAPVPRIERVVSRLGFACVLSLVVGVSLIFDTGHFRSYVISKIAVLCWLATVMLVLVHAGIMLSTSVMRKMWNPIACGIALFLAALAVATLLSPQSHVSLYGEYFRRMGLVTMLPLCLVSLAVMAFVDTDQRRESLLLACVGIGTLNAAYALAQLFGIDPFRTAAGLRELMTEYVGRPVGFSGNADFFGPMVVITSLLATYKLFAALVERRWGACLLWSASLIVQVAGLILSLTRGAWIAALVGFAVFAIVFLLKYRKAMLPNVIFLLVGVAMVMCCVYLTIGVFSADRQRLIVGKLQTIMSLSGYAGLPIERIILWRDTAGFIAHQWGEGRFTGVGLDCFGRYFMPHKSLDLARVVISGSFDNPHNNYLGMLAMTGVPGFLAYLFLFAAAFWRLGRGIVKETDFRRTALCVGMLAALVGYAVNLVTIFDTVTTYLFFFVMLGLVAGIRVGGSDAECGLAGWRRWTVVVLLLLPFPLLAMGSARMVSLWRADYYAKSGAQLIDDDPLKAREVLAKAAALCPSEAAYKVRSLETYPPEVATLAASGQVEELRKALEGARRLYRQGEPDFNNPEYSRYSMGLVLFGGGDIDGAMGCFEDALRFDRWSYQTCTLLGQLEFMKYTMTDDISFLKKAFQHSATTVSVLRNFPYRDRTALVSTLACGLTYYDKTKDAEALPDLVQAALFFVRWDFFKNTDQNTMLVGGVEKFTKGTTWEKQGKAAAIYCAYRVAKEKSPGEAVPAPRKEQLIGQMRSLGIDDDPSVKDFLKQMAE